MSHDSAAAASGLGWGGGPSSQEERGSAKSQSSKEPIMTAEFRPFSPATNDEPIASRRDFVAAAVTVAAAPAAGAPPQAQTASQRHPNPQGLSTPATGSPVAWVNGPHVRANLAGPT